MPLDPLYLAAGLGALCLLLAVVTLSLQRRLSLQRAELSLLDERLSQAVMAQEGLGAQLETSRQEQADLHEARAALQAEAAVLRRETEWLQAQRLETRETLDDLQAERDAQQAELRALSALGSCSIRLENEFSHSRSASRRATRTRRVSAFPWPRSWSGCSSSISASVMKRPT